MATTIPCILRSLGNKYPFGFTLEDLKEAFLKDGYGPIKASRRVKQVVFSREIIPADDKSEDFITIYNPFHVKNHPELEEVRIKAVKIERDGSVTYL